MQSRGRTLTILVVTIPSLERYIGLVAATESRALRHQLDLSRLLALHLYNIDSITHWRLCDAFTILYYTICVLLVIQYIDFMILCDT
ncbi:hypothetical protein ARMGADRAFT_435904 [Armillaria gallica]|uniref:Uncharacterized protein n=1 Tax=Armillaria gallica TaxID=47427 RepID=A0A2H3D2E9_ARMGA|nr:hypothetical protein ARMGADRAFT_435904 [Armillaria gallica]